MEQKKEMTKALLGGGLKELMVSHPFEKITIRMITDKAGVIRPTFYNYFQDKYELLEWVVCEELLQKVDEMLGHQMEREAMKLLFVLMEKEKTFYKKAFQVTGQNSFESMLELHFCQMLEKRLEQAHLKERTDVRILRKEVVAKYYAISVVNILKAWLLESGDALSAEDVAEGFYFMISHSIFDVLEKEE
ncbi:TetR/AcrR family transcriptional regulator C-terminal domain-containing protein [Hominifimenecus sp. rT4P-3]|uniref:TetR/AcrR family transcriptional regulator C-terminal domain-containing protein n=1 Tax=Hominifimenecus sp. rT4P-3 TaxID=3242979 RepID=UPI003DA49029